MQILHLSLKILALGCLLTTLSGAAPKAKFTVAYPNLKIKKPVWVSALPGTDQELIVSQSGTIYSLPKNRDSNMIGMDIQLLPIKEEEGEDVLS